MLIITTKDEVIGGCVLKFFNLKQDTIIYKCAMLGSVWISPSYRGAKLGSRLIAEVNDWLKQNNVDLAFLWTNKIRFYESYNWKISDGAFFGEMRLLNTINPSVNMCVVHQLTQDFFLCLEEFRKSRLNIYIPRNLNSYSIIPIPAEKVTFFMCIDNKTVIGYAIIGSKDDVAYIYELLGSHEVILSILAEIRSTYKQVFLNTSKYDFSYDLFFDSDLFNLKDQFLSMYYIINPNITEYTAKQIYIPYFDRI
jgi:N-acetylglutamate synthase-like GNAT family acetyltransferase